MADVRSTLLGVLILEEAARHSIPVVAQYKGVAEAGALLTFAHRATDGYRRAAYYVDRGGSRSDGASSVSRLAMRKATL